MMSKCACWCGARFCGIRLALINMSCTMYSGSNRVIPMLGSQKEPLVSMRATLNSEEDIHSDQNPPDAPDQGRTAPKSIRLTFALKYVDLNSATRDMDVKLRFQTEIFEGRVLLDGQRVFQELETSVWTEGYDRYYTSKPGMLKDDLNGLRYFPFDSQKVTIDFVIKREIDQGGEKIKNALYHELKSSRKNFLEAAINRIKERGDSAKTKKAEEDLLIDIEEAHRRCFGTDIVRLVLPSLGDLASREWGVCDAAVFMKDMDSDEHGIGICLMLRMMRENRPLVTNFMVITSFLVFLTAASFFFPEDDLEPRIMLVSTVILTMVALKTGAASYMPQISTLTLIDKYIFWSFVTAFLVAAQNVTLYQMSTHGYSSQLLRWTNLATALVLGVAWLLQQLGVIWCKKASYKKLSKALLPTGVSTMTDEELASCCSHADDKAVRQLRRKQQFGYIVRRLQYSPDRFYLWLGDDFNLSPEDLKDRFRSTEVDKRKHEHEEERDWMHCTRFKQGCASQSFWADCNQTAPPGADL
eukprot:366561-Chlamydomonas_euryale.AAC.13